MRALKEWLNRITRDSGKNWKDKIGEKPAFRQTTEEVVDRHRGVETIKQKNGRR